MSLFLGNTDTANGANIISVPIRFHIVTGMDMNKEGLRMDSWVTSQDIKHTIVPEVNRIWRNSDISFDIESIHDNPANQHARKASLIQAIVNAKRDQNGKSDAKRIKNLNQLIDWTRHDRDFINVYFVPYLGEKSQGNAKRKKRRVFVAQWSDKARGATKPEKFQLIEARPFKKGSLSRTLAHELGHILGLKHPNKDTQSEFNLLMGGKKAGYKIRAKEIKTARGHAKQY